MSERLFTRYDFSEKPYGIHTSQLFQGPRLMILRNWQSDLKRNFKWDLPEEEIDAVCRQDGDALTIYRKFRENRTEENSFTRKQWEALWLVSVEIAKEERKLAPNVVEYDLSRPHWLNWSKREFPCIY